MGSLSDLFNRVVGLAGWFVILIMALGTIAFLWGLITYLTGSSSEENRRDSIKYMIAGMIGLFVMIAIWGIVYVAVNTFGFRFGIPQIGL